MEKNGTQGSRESAMAVLTEMAVEGMSGLIEAQRTMLSLVERESDVLLVGFRDQMQGFVPGLVMTDFARRSVQTIAEMQQELLTLVSRQTMEWLETEPSVKDGRAVLMAMARDSVDAFAKAQSQLRDAMTEGASAALGGAKPNGAPFHKTRIAELAREAGNAFIEAQKRLLDVAGQQTNVNLDLITRALKSFSPANIAPIANMTEKHVRESVDEEKTLLQSILKPGSKRSALRKRRGRKTTKKTVRA